MKIKGLLTIALGALALAGCAGRYYDRDGYYNDGHAGPGGGVYYSDRDRANDRYYSNYPNREYRDRDSRYRQGRDDDDN